MEKKLNPSAFTSPQFGMLVLFSLAHLFHHLVNAILTPLLPMIRTEFELDYTRTGLLVTAFGVAYGISQLPGGWLADRIGPRVLITVGLSGVALGGLLVGLSSTYVMLVIFLALMGVLGGGYHPSSPPLISASVGRAQRGRALGLHSVGGGAAFFLGPLVAATLAVVWGWRGPFIALAIPTLIFGIIFYRMLGRLTGRSKQSEPGAVAGESTLPPEPGRIRRLTAIIIMNSVTQVSMIAVISFIPLYLVDHFGMAETAAAALTAVIFSAGFWAGPLGGYLSDRLGGVRVILAVCFSAGPIIFLLNLASGGWGISAVMALMGVVLYAKMPVLEGYIVSHTSAHNRSSILGIHYFGNQEAGALTPLIGFLIDRSGFYTGFTVVAAATMVVTLACSVLLLWGNRD